MKTPEIQMNRFTFTLSGSPWADTDIAGQGETETAAAADAIRTHKGWRTMPIDSVEIKPGIIGGRGGIEIRSQADCFWMSRGAEQPTTHAEVAKKNRMDYDPMGIALTSLENDKNIDPAFRLGLPRAK